MASRILLTGATGFVGQQVLKFLQNVNSDIILIVRRNSEKKIKNLIGISRIIITENLFLESEKWWTEACSGVDIVIHLAWYLEPGKYLNSNKNMDCYKGSLSLVNGAIKSKVSRFIGIGTCFEYEQSNNILTINTPLKPLTPYASAKVLLFDQLSKLLLNTDIEFVWCRLFYLFGENEHQRRLVPYIRSQLESGKTAKLSTGKQIRDFMDVKDAGKIIANIANSKIKGPVNVCSGIPITVRELAEKIADEYGRRDLLDFGAKPENEFEPSYIVGEKIII